MAGPTSISRRALGAYQLALDLTNLLRDVQPADMGQVEAVSEDTAADLWTLHLALANNMTEDEFRRKEPEVYQRLQSRYLTQAEMTRDRLHQLPYR